MVSQPDSTPSNGTNIEGDVNVDRGDFIARDKNINVQHGAYVEGDVENLYILGGPVDPTTKHKPSLEFPDLLPYRVNRKAQEEQLWEIYNGYQPDNPKPIVAFIHGNDKQAHDTFLDRLHEEFLPRLLNINSTDALISRVEVSWPVHINRFRDLSAAFSKNLAEEVLHTPSSSIGEVQSVLAGYNYPSIVATYLLTDDWMKYKKGILETILKFWNNWPAMTPSQVLFVFIFVIHRVPSSTLKKRIYTFYKRQIIKQLKNCTPEQYAKIIATVLPELGNIPQSETENWARREARNYYVGNITALLSKIRVLYDKYGELPMETLGGNLKEMLDSV